MPFYVWFAPKAIQWLEFDEQFDLYRNDNINLRDRVSRHLSSIWLVTPTVWPINTLP